MTDQKCTSTFKEQKQMSVLVETMRGIYFYEDLKGKIDDEELKAYVEANKSGKTLVEKSEK